jgi:hypothetical protein
LQFIYHTHQRLIPSKSSFVNSGNCFLFSIYISKRSEGAVGAGQVVAPQFPRERPDQFWGPPDTGVVSTESKKPGLKLTTHFRPVLRMSGAITLLLYAFVACVGTNLPCTFLYLVTFCAVPGTQNTTAALISAGVVFCVPTNCDQLSHFGQNAGQITICLPCSIQINCRVRKIAPLVFIVSQMKPLLTPKHCSCKCSLTLFVPPILPLTSKPPTWFSS